MSPSPESSDPFDLGPIDDFIQYESSSRFEPVFLPIRLFGWQSPAEHIQPTSDTGTSSAEEALSDAQIDDARELRRRLTEKLWERLYQFYEENGYRALGTLQHRLEDRCDRERRRNRALRHRAAYGAFLTERMCIPAIEEHGGDALISASGTGRSFRIAGDTRAGLRCLITPGGAWPTVHLRPSRPCLRAEGLAPEFVSAHWPFEVEGTDDEDGNEDRTWNQALKEVRMFERDVQKELLGSTDALDLIQARWVLAKRMLWQLDVAGAVRDAPSFEETRIDELMKHEQPVFQCAVILKVLPHMKTEHPTQTQLANSLKECYREDVIDIHETHFVQGAASLLNDLQSEYQDFRPDFIHELKRMEHLIRKAADQLGRDIPDPDCPESTN